MHEAMREWEAQLAPLLSDVWRKHRRGRIGLSWYTDETYIQQETCHAKLLEARLRALGGSPQYVVPAARREKEFTFYTSPEKSDEEKLQKAVGWIKYPATALKPLIDVIDQIEEDQQSKQMLRTISDDELATITWLQETRALLSATPAA